MQDTSVEIPGFARARGSSLAFIAIVYVFAILAAWWGFESVESPQWSMVTGLLVSALVCFGGILVARNGSVFDPWWSVLPPVAAVYLSLGATGSGAREIAVQVVVWTWAIRLTLNWLRGFSGLDHEDFRYTELYRNVPLPRPMVQLFLVVLSPAVIVILGCLPLHPALLSGSGGFGLLDFVALVVGLAAALIELVADEQMRAFVRTRSEGAHMESGLWRYSRHPNYFGELLFWLSLWLFALSADPGSWWTGIGFVAMAAMFVFASIPLMDERSCARRPGFAAYAERTSSLVPWPPRS